MNIFSDMGWRTVRRMILLLACFQALCACGKNEIPVNIHGVNYEDSAFSYVMSDPQNKENRAGGELIEPFSAGGIMCCYMLPKKWLPGLKVSVKWTYWEVGAGSNDMIETKRSDVLDVPYYPIGKPPEFWVLRSENNSLMLVGSDLQPDHPEWPGKIRGWPVPSLKYRRERWEIYFKVAKENVELYQHMLKSLRDFPKDAARNSWETTREHMPANLREYSGYDDPKYLSYLENEYKSGLEDSEAELKELLRKRP